MSYRAPVRDIKFALTELAGMDQVTALPGYEEATPDLVAAVLEEAAKLADEVLAPLNHTGDQQGSHIEEGVVTTPEGWQQAYQTFTEGGWNSLPFPTEFGGQGLPNLISSAVQEMWAASNMAFGLCPLLTQGAIEALLLHGSENLQQTYLPKMVSGEWTGTMNLTEPQAGSDLAAVRTRAEPAGDHYRISGQKIYITYGEHDLTDNIIHLVLARTPDAPEGVKGISLFVVPKYLVNEDGSLGQRNDVKCVSIEHKLGIHASPTCVLQYGDQDGAIGYLVGEENKGLIYMFTMMNLARHSVGIEGFAIAERAYQQALAYSKDRVQGQPIGHQNNDRPGIIAHPDVRRMLMTMKSQIEAMRAVAYYSAACLDKAQRHTDPAQQQAAQALFDLLTPVVKGWSTELGVEMASIGVQIHGGMGFIEETGAAQHLRDSRIAPIYEGTNGIQANDLVGRKILREQGTTIKTLIGEIKYFDQQLATEDDPAIAEIRAALSDALSALSNATNWLLAANDPRLPAAISFPFLKLFGTVAGGWQMARAALIAKRKLNSGDSEHEFYDAKLKTALFYALHILPQAGALAHTVQHGANATIALEDSQF